MSNVLLDLSESMASIVETSGAAIVRVDARQRIPASGVVWSADGLIVTAHHVVKRDSKIRVGLPDGEIVGAELVGRDPTSDLALLRADAQGLTPPTWNEPDTVKVGHVILALGRSGESIQAAMGIVTALGKGRRVRGGRQIDHFFQTDVVMFPGFSGGPLVDASGHMLGINTSALLRRTSLTLPVTTVRRVVKALLTHGQVRQGYLGVSIQPVRLPEAMAEQLGQKTGLLLTSVKPGSPADQAGLLIGDILVTVDDQPVSVHHHDKLLVLSRDDLIGETLPACIVRGGQVQELQITIGEQSR